MIFESDPTYPHGKLAAKQLTGVDGFLLALQYKNPASLGKALRELRGIIYKLPPENDRALIWLADESVTKLPNNFKKRLKFLSQFEEQEKVVGKCEKCKSNVAELFNSGRKHVLLTCLKCSPYKADTRKATRAKFEANNVLAQREASFKRMRATRRALKIAA